MYDYIYLSLRHLSDLAGQLPPKTLGKIEATIKGTIPGILEASLEGERTSDDPRLFDLLSRVEQALKREGKIGSIGENKDWLAGIIEMYWVPLQLPWKKNLYRSCSLEEPMEFKPSCLADL